MRRCCSPLSRREAAHDHARGTLTELGPCALRPATPVRAGPRRPYRPARACGTGPAGTPAERSHPRRPARQHHAVLADEHRVSAARLYWENKAGFFNAKNISIPLPSASSPTSSIKPRGAGRKARIPTTSSITTGSTGGPLRGLGTAAALLRRDARQLQATAQVASTGAATPTVPPLNRPGKRRGQDQSLLQSRGSANLSGLANDRRARKAGFADRPQECNRRQILIDALAPGRD
jgi:hypothetical protein